MSECMAHEIVIRIQSRITRGLKDFLADKRIKENIARSKKITIFKSSFNLKKYFM